MADWLDKEKLYRLTALDEFDEKLECFSSKSRERSYDENTAILEEMRKELDTIMK
jgi:hypothetical protein